MAARKRGTPTRRRDTTERPSRGRITLLLPAPLLEEVRDAVVHLAGPPEHLTLAALTERALTRELARLKAKHTRGAPFPRRPTRKLRAGRPIGT